MVDHSGLRKSGFVFLLDVFCIFSDNKVQPACLLPLTSPFILNDKMQIYINVCSCWKNGPIVL